MADIRSLSTDKTHIKGELYSTLMAAQYSKTYDREYARIWILRGITVVERSSNFKFGKRQLENVLYGLSLRYDVSDPLLRFMLLIWSPKEDYVVETNVELRPPMELKHLRVAQRRKLIASTVKAVQTIASQTYRKVVPRTSRKPQLASGQLASQSITESWIDIDKTLGLPDVLTSGTKETYNKLFSSVNTPGFKSAARQGLLHPNPHASIISRVDKGSLNHVYGYTHIPSGGVSRFEHIGGYTNRLTIADVNSPHRPVNENIIIARLRSQIGVGVSANLGEDVAQIGLTLRLLRDSAVKLYGLAQLGIGNAQGIKNVYGSRGFKHISADAELLADLWLQYRYAWIPLVQTIDACKVAFFSKVSKNPAILSVKASMKDTYRAKDNFFVTNPIGGEAPFVGTKVTKIETKVKIGFRYGIDSSLVNTASQLGLTGPTNLVWNLIPFSFVVDWWLPIGGMLEAYSAFDGLRFIDGYKTRFTRTKVTIECQGSSTKSDDTYDQYGSYAEKCYGEGIRLNREVITDFPEPSLPFPKNPVSVIHAANAAALLTKLVLSR